MDHPIIQHQQEPAANNNNASNSKLTFDFTLSHSDRTMVTPTRRDNYRRLFHENNSNKRRREALKESLRKACLDRARNNRRDILTKRRRMIPQSQNNMATEDDYYDSTTTAIMGDYDDNALLLQEQAPVDATDVQKVVQEELRYRGIGIVSPCYLETNVPTASSTSTTNTTKSFCIEDEEERGGVAFYLSDSHIADSPPRNSVPIQEPEFFLDEDELYELMQEVEEEIYRSEDFLLEEILEEEKNQHLLLEEQIAEYQEWEEQSNFMDAPASSNGGSEAVMDHCAGDEQEGVLCPLCHEAALITTKASAGIARTDSTNSYCTIVCPNHHSINGGCCALHLQGKNNSLTLTSLREHLALVYQEHSYSCCPGNLTFEVVPSQGAQGGYNGNGQMDATTTIPTLGASCGSCHWSSVVI